MIGWIGNRQVGTVVVPPRRGRHLGVDVQFGERPIVVPLEAEDSRVLATLGRVGVLIVTGEA